MNKFLILLVLFAAGCSDDSETDNGEAQNGKSDDVGLSQSEKEFNKGVDFAKKGDYQTAISCYTEAIRLNPKDADAYSIRGIAYQNLEKYDEAIRDYSDAIRLNPKYGNAYYNRGIAYQEKGDSDKAKADFDMAKKLGFKPNNP